MLTSGHLALVFPGQGSQAVGMGKAWAEAYPLAAETFREADETLGFALSELCWQGPEEKLQLTANTQPAILTTSVAAYRCLAAEHDLQPAAMAGHSLGEYSALVAAGTLEFADALRLVRRRGELMQEAVPVGEGAMAAILGLEAAAVEELAAAATLPGAGSCSVANYNSPVQTVIAGDREAVERAIEAAREAGAKRALMLPVSAPFHSPLMAPARAGLEPLLAATTFADPAVPVVVNVDARAVTRGDAARDALVRQIDGSVRWVESVRWMIDELGVESFLEVGPGAVLTGLIRRIERGAAATTLAGPETIAELKGGDEK